MTTPTKMPETLSRLNAEVRRRDAHGLCVDITDASGEVLRDEKDGMPFLRLRVTFADGDVYRIDSREANPLIVPLLAH